MSKLLLLCIPLLLSGCSLFTTSKPASFPEPRAVDIVVPALNELAEVVTPIPTPMPAVSIESTPGTQPAVKTFSIVATQWTFEPSTITVKEGDRVKLSVTSADVAHGIALPDFGIAQSVQPGQTVDVELVANKKGRFSFFCNVYCGQGHINMKGLLIVE